MIDFESLPSLREAVRSMEQRIDKLNVDVDRFRGLAKTYRAMLRYDWIAQQDRNMKAMKHDLERMEHALMTIAVLAEFGTTGPGKCDSPPMDEKAATALRRAISDIAREALEVVNG